MDNEEEQKINLRKYKIIYDFKSKNLFISSKVKNINKLKKKIKKIEIANFDVCNIKTKKYYLVIYEQNNDEYEENLINDKSDNINDDKEIIKINALCIYDDYESTGFELECLCCGGCICYAYELKFSDNVVYIKPVFEYKEFNLYDKIFQKKIKPHKIIKMLKIIYKNISTNI